MKLSKTAKQLAEDLGLSELDAYMMELKANLYKKSAGLIKASKKTHEEIAKSIGTSRSRINRIANHGENNVSIELLIKLITVLEGRPVKRERKRYSRYFGRRYSTFARRSCQTPRYESSAPSKSSGDCKILNFIKLCV